MALFKPATAAPVTGSRVLDARVAPGEQTTQRLGKGLRVVCWVKQNGATTTKKKGPDITLKVQTLARR